MSSRGTRLRPVLAVLLGVLLSAGGLVTVAAPAVADIDPPRGTPATVTADALPTVQHNGVVWSQAVVGDIVYAGGSFTAARPAGSRRGQNEVPRANLLAYDIRTGELVKAFAPVVNQQVRTVAASPDGTRLYIGGDFTEVDGKTRSRIAALDLRTGALVGSFVPLAGTTVRTITATNSVVYFGGDFRKVNGVPRAYVAAVSASDGALLDWDPSPDAAVYASTLTHDRTRLVIGGRFDTVNGAPAVGMVAVDPTTGASYPWKINKLVRNSGKKASITSLSADGSGVYGTGYNYEGRDHYLEGAFRADPRDGSVRWIEDCHGDSYSAYPAGQAVYVASHAYYCGNLGGFPLTKPETFRRATAFSKRATTTLTADPHDFPSYAGQPAPSLLNWYPALDAGSYTGQDQAAWSVTGNGDYVAYGGEFPRVNGTRQQGLVRFAVAPKAPQKVGPVAAAGLTPDVVALKPGEARVSFVTTHDSDNESLTYKVYRNFRSLRDKPVFTTTRQSLFWELRRIRFRDKTVASGKRYSYRVYAFDSSGNRAKGKATAVRVPPKSSLGAYPRAVLRDRPDRYYRLGERSGTTVYDWATAKDAIATAEVRRGRRGATGDGDRASGFDGAHSLVVDRRRVAGPHEFSLEGWFKTRSKRGGKVVSFGDARSGWSKRNDRHIYLNPKGRVFFGVHPGARQTVASAKRYNDGRWHHVVATLSKAGMRLYVDAKLVAKRTDVKKAERYRGYWRIGGDTPWAGKGWFDGGIDDVATYPTVLGAKRVKAHWKARVTPRPKATEDTPEAGAGTTPR